MKGTIAEPIRRGTAVPALSRWHERCCGKRIEVKVAGKSKS